MSTLRIRDHVIYVEPSGKRKQRFRGRVYVMRPNRYYTRANVAPRISMHRAVWEYHNGPVPDGCNIHHIDGDPANNNITNLVAMPILAHSALHRKLQWARRGGAFAEAAG